MKKCNCAPEASGSRGDRESEEDAKGGMQARTMNDEYTPISLRESYLPEICSGLWLQVPPEKYF